ncbi:unnamed protein product [Didymodactylos carnosus]|uniref:Macoilin n=1 Tax=Didymodactylos carnosus TaxID=1234261 RepID=A0A8S2EHY9_9BILA|nr:unnamed protein product [Didymodactylos carnosus]CAF3997359.1 unnamed protein product [Didymodactylos carnosus]
MEERGICLGTVVLWVLFVWLEASVRLREIKTIDLCRPFAAHCIGYPMVTLGFGFKTYLAYKWRLRTQRDVRKTNESYAQLLYQALPTEVQQSQQEAEKEKLKGPFPEHYDECTSNHSNTNAIQQSLLEPDRYVAPLRDRGGSNNTTTSSSNNDIHSILFSSSTTLPSSSSTTTFSSTSIHNNNNNLNSNSFLSSLLQSNSTQIPSSCTIPKRSKTTAVPTAPDDSSYNNLISTNNSSVQLQRSSKSSYSYSHTNGHVDEEIADSYKQQKSSHLNSAPSLSSLTNGPSTTTATNRKKERFNGQNTTSVITSNSTVNNRRQQKNQSTHDLSTHINGFATSDSLDMDKSAQITKLESDIQRLNQSLEKQKASDLQLRAQLNDSKINNKNFDDLKTEHTTLQTKYETLTTQRQRDKQRITDLERNFAEERQTKQRLELQIKNEKSTAKKLQDDMAKLALVPARNECSDQCLKRKRDQENETRELRKLLQDRDDKIKILDNEIKTLMKYRESHADTEVLYQHLTQLQDRNAHLQDSLSAETRIKLDLFSALGEVKRQLEIAHNNLRDKDLEIQQLHSHLSGTMVNGHNHGIRQNSGCSSPTNHLDGNNNQMIIPTSTSAYYAVSKSPPPTLQAPKNSNLDPNAQDYCPTV